MLGCTPLPCLTPTGPPWEALNSSGLRRRAHRASAGLGRSWMPGPSQCTSTCPDPSSRQPHEVGTGGFCCTVEIQNGCVCVRSCLWFHSSVHDRWSPAAWHGTPHSRLLADCYWGLTRSCGGRAGARRAWIPQIYLGWNPHWAVMDSGLGGGPYHSKPLFQ